MPSGVLVGTTGGLAWVDYLSLIFSNAVYLRLVEKHFPHVPSVGKIRSAVEGMTRKERQMALANARKMREVADLVEEALSAK